MSEERNFKCYLQDVHGKQDPHDAIIAAAGLKIAKDKDGTVIAGGDGEREIRRKLSVAVGKVEEKLHGTYVDDETGKRVNPCPERYNAHHNRLVEECYQKVAGQELPVD